MKRITVILLCLCLMTGLLAGCGDKDTPAVTDDSVLHLMWAAQIGTDSIFETPWRDLQCLYPYMVFEALCNYEADGTFVPKLAVSYEVSDDELTYAFTLRDGVQWHDGTAFTADDVVFSLWGILSDPKASSYNAGLSYIEGADDVTQNGAGTLSGVSADGNVVTIQLAKPYSLFISTIAKAYILPKHLLGSYSGEELSTNEAYWTKPVGTGQYVVDEVSFPDYCVLVRNASYWGPVAGIEKVQFTSYVTGGTSAVTNALIAGELDFAYGNELNDVSVANSIHGQNADVKVLEMVSNYQRQFLYNWVESEDGKLHPDLAKTDVRKAIDMLIDKDAIAALYGENATALTTHLNPDSLMYNTDLTPFKRDVETATQMLKDAGFDFEHTLRIAYYYNDQMTLDIMDLVRQNLGDAGITVETFLLQGDLGVLIYEDRNYDMLYCGEAADDAGQMYFYLLGVGGYFDAIVGSPDERQVLFNDVIDQYNAAADFDEQTTLAWQLQANGVEFCGISPVVGIKTLTLYNAARVNLPEAIFDVDWKTRDWKFEDWSMAA